MRNIPLLALALALWSSNASAAQGLRTVYLSFDGVTLNRSTTVDDATVNVSFIVNSATEVISAMTTGDLIDVGGLSRQQVIDRVLADLEAIFEPCEHCVIVRYHGTLTGGFNTTNIPPTATLDYGTGTNSQITLHIPPPGTLTSFR